MKIRDLLSGLATGYLTKVIQFAVSLALVPFFLRGDVLGLTGFGRAATILAAVQFLAILIDGMRLSFTRAVTQAINDPGGRTTPGEALGSGAKILVGSCLLLGGSVGLAAAPVLRFLGLPVEPDTLRGLWLAVALFCAENCFNLLQAPLMARGSISFINHCVTVETLVRAAGHVVMLTLFPHSLTAYFGVFTAATLLRQAVFVLWLRLHFGEDLRGAARARLVRALPALRYSMPLALYWGTTTVLQRAPIVLASQFIGVEASGMMAIVVSTIRGYFLQVLFSVVQPVEVPVGSLLDPRRLSPGTRTLLWDLEAVYVVLAMGTIACASSVAPLLLQLWLGEGYLGLALPTQIVLLGCGVELSLTLRRSILTGQGLLMMSAARYAVSGALAIMLCLASALLWRRWEPMAVTVGLFLLVGNAWAIGVPFQRSFESLGGPHWLRIPTFAIACTGIAICLSWLAAPGNLLGGLLALSASAALVLILAHLTLLPLRRAAASLARVRELGSRSLLAGADPPILRASGGAP